MLFCNKRGHTFSFLCSTDSRNWFCTTVDYVWSLMSQICRSVIHNLYQFHSHPKNHSFLPFKTSNFLCYPLKFLLLPFGQTFKTKAKKYLCFLHIFFEYGSRMHFKSIQYMVVKKSWYSFLTHILFLKNKLNWNPKKIKFSIKNVPCIQQYIHSHFS
jgi:hypothetical protein